MDYKTMDWEAEAKRVAAAFELDFPCYFDDAEVPGRIGSKGERARKGKVLTPYIIEEDRTIHLNDGYELKVEYTRIEQRFSMSSHSNTHLSLVSFRDDGCKIASGNRITKQRFSIFSPDISKALFCLDLLTPEVEVALKVAISSHQKIEWLIEYEDRLNAQKLRQTYEDIDWQAEARRISDAFDLQEECEFECTEKHIPRAYRLRSQSRPFYDINGRGPIVIQVKYTNRGRHFSVTTGLTSTYINISWAGLANSYVPRIDSTVPLARALFHLGLLMPEVESELEVNISERQKLEWQLEFEARMKGQDGTN